MSCCYLNSETCTVCGISYKEFRCSITTFAEAKQALYNHSEQDSSKWKYKRRHSVLGYWHYVKKTEWFYHLEQCGTGKYVNENIQCVSIEY